MDWKENSFKPVDTELWHRLQVTTNCFRPDRIWNMLEVWRMTK